MFGDEQASAKEISLFLFVRLQCQGSAASETTKPETHMQSPHLRLFISRNYWVSSHTSNFSTVGRSDPEIRRLGARAHVQRCPTPPMTCGKHPLSDPPTHIPNLNTIGRAVPEIKKRGVHVRTCRDTPPMTCDKHLVHDPELAHQN